MNGQDPPSPNWALAWDLLQDRLRDAVDNERCPTPGVVMTWMLDAELMARCARLRCPACGAAPGVVCQDPHRPRFSPHPARRYRAARS